MENGKSKMLSHSITIRVRYAETDQMKVVYYSNYLVYFEIGRTELLRSIGLPYTELEKLGYILPVIETYARYFKAASYDDLIEIKTTLGINSNIKIKLNYEIINHTTKEKISEGYTIHAFVDARTMKPKKAPEIFLNTIKKYLNNYVR